MKTILMATDFSTSAVHASKSAARLAEKLHTKLLLWNCGFKLPVFPPYLGGTMTATVLVGTKENRDKLDLALQQLEDFILSTDGDYRPQLSTHYREGALDQELAKELHEQLVELVVIGASAGSTIDHIFAGSDTFKVIQTANCPVLIVPPRGGLDLLDKVVFATDFQSEDINAIVYLYKLSQKLDFELEIVHVTVNGDMDAAMLAKESAFSARLRSQNMGGIPYRQIRGKEVTGRLNRLCKQTGADILAMTHHQYSYLKRLLTDSMAKKELAHQKVPLLLFPIK
jgi:nucleotide-binding universal stress UspA family protein